MYRLGPRAIILDTEIVLGTGPIIRFRREGHWSQSKLSHRRPAYHFPSSAARTMSFIALMCDFSGYELTVIDWQSMGISNWEGINDYQADKRRTYVLRSKTPVTLQAEANGIDE